jgi:glycosyltransferase involved in cell wall biosynthesis
MTASPPTVLVLSRYFRQGFETGPTQSLLGMVAALSDRFRFRVVAEAMDETPGEWGKAYGVDRLPLAGGLSGPGGMRRAINETPHDIVMAVSFFDPAFTILPLLLRRAGLLRPAPMLVAPRGEFSPGALALSAARKSVYIRTSRAFGLLKGVSLQATSQNEAAEIRSRLAFTGPVHVTPNIRAMPALPRHAPGAAGQPLRVAFLSRIDRKKNLLFALDVVAEAGIPIVFNIFGGVFHPDYWLDCLSRIDKMPAAVSVAYHGSIPQRDVVETLAAQDLFLLPTLGENFGHSIADALCAGTPVLLSDQTPWRGLAERNAGWDLPLSDPAAFAAALRSFHAMREPERMAMRRCARREAEEKLDTADAARSLATCFAQLMLATEK